MRERDREGKREGAIITFVGLYLYYFPTLEIPTPEIHPDAYRPKVVSWNIRSIHQRETTKVRVIK